LIDSPTKFLALTAASAAVLDEPEKLSEHTSTANDPGVPERSGATLEVSDVEALGDCP
jgi:hypothetical protein